MKWLLCLTMVGACGFGDNVVARNHGEGPDASVISQDGDTHTSSTDGPVATACTLVPQSGCDGATPACDLTFSYDGSTECRAVTHQGASTSHCALDTDCMAGFTCLQGATPSQTWCARFCEHDSDCMGVGSRCVDPVMDAMGHAIPDVWTCSTSCDPVARTGCPSGMGCGVWADANGGADFSDCAYMGTTAADGSCDYDDECRPGTTCVNLSTGGSVCEKYCRVGHDTDCPTDETCLSFTTPVTVGGIEYGTCY